MKRNEDLDPDPNEDEELDEDEFEYIEDGSSRIGMLAVGLLVGALIGASVVLLTAPERGETTRRRLGRRIRHISHDAKDQLADWGEEAGQEFDKQRRRIRRRLKRLR
jgi:gas vesicle protein